MTVSLGGQVSPWAIAPRGWMDGSIILLRIDGKGNPCISILTDKQLDFLIRI
jgi:hypothetical protein